MGFKRFFKKTLKFNKDILTGKIVKKSLKAAVKFAKKNPELTGAAIGIATGGTGFLAGLGGLFGGGQQQPQGFQAPSSSGFVGPEQVGEGVATDSGFAPPIPKELLFGGAAVLALILITRK